MSESVKCRSCAESTPFEPDKLYPAIKDGIVTDGGSIPSGGWGQTKRLLFWVCPDCRQSDKVLVLPVELQCIRITDGRKRLEAAGKDRATAIAAAVNSQMDEDERRRFPGFYHWRRVREAEALGAWQPPKPDTWAIPAGLPEMAPKTP